MAARLANRRILVPESRELDIFAHMLEAEGATAIRCPLVTILDLEDPKPVERWIKRLIAGEFDDLILLTGEGLRRILIVADHIGAKDAAVEAIGKLRTVIRGPKPAKALRDIGLAPGLTAVAPTTEGVIQTLSAEDLKGRRVGVQLYPGNPNDLLLDFLRSAGATPAAVVPYRYASDADAGAVAGAIRAMAEGRIDCVAFTSSPQIDRLQEVAKERGLEAELKMGLVRTRIAAVGPIVAEAVERIGGKIAAEPAKSFHLKPLVNAIAAALG
ncbi:MAG TPA: uroporphyrinogen-III synthase [Alphaproteobacteria bacterium]|nr:uroporphyrinogen-III synthase [Alphaproteobacteria bacterium]